jgi:hypothetical protein
MFDLDTLAKQILSEHSRKRKGFKHRPRPRTVLIVPRVSTGLTRMSQQDQGNKQSMKGDPKHADSGQAGKKSVKSDLKVGSSDGDGIRFPVHNYTGMAVQTPGK